MQGWKQQAADGVSLFIKEWGQGRPVVLLHGWPLSSESFDDLGVAIADSGRRAITYDRRGFGLSDKPSAGYDFNTLADDLGGVMRSVGATDATLLGFSMGGGEVARYISRSGGEQVRDAILVASVVPYMLRAGDNPDGIAASAFDSMITAITTDREAFWPSFLVDTLGLDAACHAGDLVVQSCLNAMQAGLEATVATAKALASTDFRPDLDAFNVPTLIIHGTADRFAPIDATGRAAAQGIPNSTLIEYDGGPHGLLVSHKNRVIKDVLNFLGEASQPLPGSGKSTQRRVRRRI